MEMPLNLDHSSSFIALLKNNVIKRDLRKKRVILQVCPEYSTPLWEVRAKTQTRNLKSRTMEECCLLTHSITLMAHAYLPVLYSQGPPA